MNEYKRLTERNKRGEWCTKSGCSLVYSKDGSYAIGEAIDRLAELEDKLENGKIIDISNPNEREKKFDSVMKVNMYIMRKYGKEFREEFGIIDGDNSLKNIIKLMDAFDKIAEEMNKEFPFMWYEYGFNGSN